MRFFLFFLGMLTAATTVFAAASDLDKIRQEMEKEEAVSIELKKRAAVISREIKDMQQETVSAARSVQDQEQILLKLDAHLKDLEQELITAKGRLSIRDNQVVNVILALQTLSVHPAEAVFAQPAPLKDIVQGSSVLREILPQVQDSIQKLRKDLEVLSSLQTAVKLQYMQVKKTSEELEARQKNLKKLMQRKGTLQKETEAKSKFAKMRSDELARQAKDLQDLLAKLEREQKAREEERKRRLAEQQKEAPSRENVWVSKAFEAAKGKIPPPVMGSIVKFYGEASETGIHSKGITIQSLPEAQVVAPYDGLVLYAGKFRGYGQLLILDHGEGYHTVLAGMNNIEVIVGQPLLAGEPVGTMGPGQKKQLYLELRKGGQSINPLPWLMG